MRRCLTIAGAIIKLPPKQFDVLLFLLKNSGRVVHKDELLQAAWGSRVVEEGNLSQTIFLLRKALQGKTDGPLIVTAPGQGYRFAGSVEWTGSSKANANKLAPRLPQSAAFPLAKLSPPRLPETVARPRLFSMLEAYLTRRVIWVTGPPGAGKTTLVGSFFDQASITNLWYVVDAGDTDPAAFFYYLRQLAGLDNAAALPLLSPEHLTDIPRFTRSFFRTFITLLLHPLVLVVDNFQEASGTTTLSNILRDAASELGLGACLIIISREEPPAAFARLRANRDMAQVRWEDLRLTDTETTAIVTSRNPTLAASTAVLHERSGGWAAGLTLLMVSKRLTGSASLDCKVETPQDLFDYFATELFHDAPIGLQRLLLSTAYLLRFTSQTATHLSGEEKSATLLDALVRRRIFTDAYVANEVHYQYHALFREFLVQQANHQYTTAERRSLIIRSADAAVKAGDFEDALSLFQQAEDHQAGAALLLAQAPLLYSQGRWQTLNGWLKRQPVEQIETSPGLCYWLAVSTGWTDQAAGRALMKRAYHSFVSLGDKIGQTMSACGIVDSYLADWQDPKQAEYWTDLLESVLSEGPLLPSYSMDLRIHSVLLAALTAFKPQHPLIARCTRRVSELCTGIGYEEIAVGARLMAAADLVFSLTLLSSSSAAQRTAEEFMDVAMLPEITPLQRCAWLDAISYSKALRGDISAYKLNWQTVEQVASQAGLLTMITRSKIEFVSGLLFAGNLGEAEQRLRGIAILPEDQTLNAICYHLNWAWLSLLQGRAKLALEHCKKLHKLHEQFSLGIRGAIILGMFAHALAAQGHTGEALAKAREAKYLFVNPSHSAIHFFTLLVEADITICTSTQSEQAMVLAEAFATGRRGNHCMTFPWLPQMMTRLAARALQLGVETAYVQQMVSMHSLKLTSTIEPYHRGD